MRSVSHRGRPDHFFQQLLAFEKGESACIAAIEVQEIEDEIDEIGFFLLLEYGLEQGEVASALAIEDHHFAVENSFIDFQQTTSAPNVGYAPSPIEPIACEQLYSLIGRIRARFRMDVHLNAIAIELQFMNPISACWMCAASSASCGGINPEASQRARIVAAPNSDLVVS